jgi:hypothetical protein
MTTKILEPKRQGKARAAIEEQLRRWYKNIPNKREGSLRRKWLKALARKSMRAAVQAKCEDCMAFEQAEARRCEVVTCPLFQYRLGARTNGETETVVRQIADGLASEQE